MEKSHKKGFTLIELSIVIAIIGILSIVIIPKVRAVKFEAKNKVVKDNIDIVRDYIANTARDYEALNNSNFVNFIAEMRDYFNQGNGDDISNPFTDGKEILADNGEDSSIVVINNLDKPLANKQPLNYDSTDLGKVFVSCYKDGFVVDGIDGYGKILSNNQYVILMKEDSGTNPPTEKTVAEKLQDSMERLEPYIKGNNGGLEKDLQRIFKAPNSIVNPVTGGTSIDYVKKGQKVVSGLSVAIINNQGNNYQDIYKTNPLQNWGRYCYGVIIIASDSSNNTGNRMVGIDDKGNIVLPRDLTQ